MANPYIPGAERVNNAELLDHVRQLALIPLAEMFTEHGEAAFEPAAHDATAASAAYRERRKRCGRRCQLATGTSPPISARLMFVN